MIGFHQVKAARAAWARFWQIGCQIAVLNREQLRKCRSPSKHRPQIKRVAFHRTDRHPVGGGFFNPSRSAVAAVLNPNEFCARK
jgi:hypothetical protein